MTSSNFNPDDILAHSPWIRKVVRSMLADEHLADDLAQATIEVGLRRGESIQGSTRGWLYGVARNLHRQFLRGQKRREVREQKVAVPDHLPDSDELVEKVETRKSVEEAVLALPAELRDLMILRFYEELTVPQIAKLKGVSVKAMESRLHRAKQLLRGQLQSRFGNNWIAVVLPLAGNLPVAASPTPVSLILMNKYTQAVLVSVVGIVGATLLWPNSDGDVNPNEVSLSSSAESGGEEASFDFGAIDADLDPASSPGQPARSNNGGSGNRSQDFSVRIIDDEGSGIADARIIPWSGESILPEAHTDATGTAYFDQLGGDGGFAVLAPNYVTAFFPQNLDQLSVELELARGETVAGAVHFVGPVYNPDPIKLKFMTRQSPPPSVVSKTVLDQLGWIGVHPGFVQFSIEEDGSFHVQGVPADWSGFIGLLAGAMFESVSGPATITKPTEVAVSAISEDLYFGVRQMRGVSGRIVSPNGSHGVGGVELNVGVYIQGVGVFPISTFSESKEDGTFFAPLWLSSDDDYERWRNDPESMTPTAVYVGIGETENWAGGEYRIEQEDRLDIWNVGDLAMANWQTQNILVVDESGQPIEGALAYAGVMSEPTGESGAIQIKVWPGTDEIAVNAPGYEIVTKSLLTEDPEVMEFRLPPAAQWTVQWQAPADKAMSSLTFQIQSSGIMFEGEEGLGPHLGSKFRRAFGFYPSSGASGSDINYLSWKLQPGQTEFTVWGLQTGVPMTASLIGKSKTQLTSTDAVAFQPGENRTDQLPAIQELDAFGGRVLGASGQGLDGVSISLTLNKRYIFRQASAADGSFSFEELGSGNVSLQLRKAGYANLDIEEFSLPGDGSPMDITMEASRPFKLYFRDTDGNNQPGGSVFFNQDQGSRLEGGYGFSMSAVPPSSFDLWWRIGGLKGIETIPANVTEYVIEVPAMASATVQIPPAVISDRMGVYLTAKLLDPVLSEDDFELRKGINPGQLESGTNFKFPSLLPGTYEFQLAVWSRADGELTWDFHPALVVGPVEAVAGQHLEIEFSNP